MSTARTAPQPLTAETVLRELAEIARERPDYSYEAPRDLVDALIASGTVPDYDGRLENICLYVHHGEPGCIVGHWLHRYRGISLERLRRFESQGVGEVVSGLRDFSLTPDALGALRNVQSAQDSGDLWAVAVRAAAHGHGVEVDL